MNTKSMILALNSLLLFNTVHPGFGISSFRKKLVNTCAKLGKKSIFVLCGMALILLTTLGLKGGEYLKSRLTRGAQVAFHNLQGSQLASTFGRRQIQSRASQSSKRVPLASSDFASTIFGPKPQTSFETFDDQTQSDEQQLDDKCDQEMVLAVATLYYKQQFKQVLDKIKDVEYSLNYLPKQLRGPRDNPNLLEIMPKWVVNMIIQFIHQDDLYHERSFYVPRHKSESKFLQGRSRSDWVDWSQSSTINFIDGNPSKLELAYCPPQNRSESGGMRSIDVITIDTTTCAQNIENNVQRESLEDRPTSYQQRVIGRELLSQKSFSVLPLLQQFSFIDRYNSSCRMWRENNSSYTHEEVERYRIGNASCWSRKNPFIYGLQRNLLNGRVVWVLPKDKWVGIYEKEGPWYAKDGAFKHPKFDSKIQDHSGTQFYLVQVIQEESKVYTIALPHTPVYLKDKDGKEIVGCVGLPPYDATAHLYSSGKYSKRIDALAVGFNPAYTNKRVSLYKQRGDNLRDYPPELLLYQKASVIPKRKSRLYPDEPDMSRPSFNLHEEIHIGLNMVRRAAGQAIGIEQPDIE